MQTFSPEGELKIVSFNFSLWKLGNLLWFSRNLYTHLIWENGIIAMQFSELCGSYGKLWWTFHVLIYWISIIGWGYVENECVSLLATHIIEMLAITIASQSPDRQHRKQSNRRVDPAKIDDINISYTIYSNSDMAFCCMICGECTFRSATHFEGKKPETRKIVCS